MTMWRARQTSTDAGHLNAEQSASALAQHLQAGGALAPIPVTDLALAEEERAYADVACAAARFYGTDVIYPPRAGYFEHHPSFGRRWVPNRRLDARRSGEAEADAQERWRDHMPARVVLTSIGLRLQPPGSNWLPFDHALLTHAERRPSGVVLSYSVCAPLFLSGSAAPWLGVAIQHLASHGV
ncbi:hypothetical protein [Streptomyces sp. 891-h]|uniref:hypothetical protein n=1 Tax=Streptomyces sp. 891-h TaxID=2720714 RepID=UPI001FA9D280|nr:hypothetical protein [Streptomyces sp. 891-h]UNZ18175.1 hypothetical protein HC362_15100 [Streptomyces sp. 891-h]